MPTPTYIPIATLTLGSAQSSVTFGSISQSYRDLVLVMSMKHSYAGSIGVRDNGVRFNSDTGSNYTDVHMNGTGSSALSSTNSGSSLQLLYGMASANFLGSQMQIMDYSATDKHKSVLYRGGLGNDSNYGAYAMAGRWANTAAVTTITIQPSGSYTILAGSTLSLYGIH